MTTANNATVCLLFIKSCYHCFFYLINCNYVYELVSSKPIVKITKIFQLFIQIQSSLT